MVPFTGIVLSLASSVGGYFFLTKWLLPDMLKSDKVICSNISGGDAVGFGDVLDILISDRGCEWQSGNGPWQWILAALIAVAISSSIVFLFLGFTWDYGLPDWADNLAAFGVAVLISIVSLSLSFVFAHDVHKNENYFSALPLYAFLIASLYLPFPTYRVALSWFESSAGDYVLSGGVLLGTYMGLLVAVGIAVILLILLFIYAIILAFF